MRKNRSFRVEYVQDMKLTLCECRLYCNVVTDTAQHLTHRKEEKYPRQVNVKTYNMLRA
jgi:hypothetical protein